ncbi:trichohyalin-like [Drosophila rhopaloa]|uniref:Uncharacterized protein n=1 Tax=Drosophila rhopaloa TaxID=1041015 RepID=A0ABM5J7F1_DRORH|nr:trichohyalin-like [Drosophila rhopaloa]
MNTCKGQELYKDPELRNRTIPEYRNPERVRDAAARTIRREDTEERRQEQVQNTADHATRRNNPEFRISERIRDAAARAAHREDPEERAREQERNTGEHRQRRRDMEDRQRERERDADNRRATRRNPIARSQEQRINTSQRRETRQQRRIREEQIRQMAEDRLLNFRMDSQNRLDASQRQSQRNMDARAQLSEDELARERGQQRNRIRSSARDLYHRNIKEGPTAICICCGGTWFRSQYRNPERVRDAAARAIRREVTEERRQEQVQNTADHASRRNNPEYRISERIRDAAARAAHREDPEERAREQERNTGEHRQRRRDVEDRQRERERDADNRRATRRNPIARSQEQRINTSQRRETRQQRRIREEQIRQMAEDRLLNFRMDSQNRLDASQRQSPRNMDARAQLSEDELEQERGQHRNRIRSSARDLYHRNIKEGPTAVCICCGGTWFRSQRHSVNLLPTALVRLETGSRVFDTAALIDPCTPMSCIDASLASSFRLPTTNLSDAVRTHFRDITLADERFYLPATISIILGADMYPNVMRPGFLKLQDGLPVAQSTVFGWVVSGACHQP